MGFVVKKQRKAGPRYSAVFNDGEGKRHWEGGFKLKKDAEALLKRRVGEVAAGTYGREELTLGEFYARWIASKHNLKPSTMVSYEHTFRLHILPTFEGEHLRAITPPDVQRWIDGLAGSGLSPATVGRCFRYFRACMKQAEAWDLIDRSPTVKISLPRKDAGELDFLEPDDILRLLDAAREQERPLFATLAMSGLRLGEALSLRWRDVDSAMRAIIVTRSWSYHGGFVEPKTTSSRRAVPLLDALSDILHDYYHDEGGPAPDDLLFSVDGEKPIDPANARKRFIEALDAAGLKHVTMHSLRHGYASIMLSCGASVKALQQALGHASATMTLNTYAHLVPGDMDATLVRANRAFVKGDGKVVPFPRKKGASGESQ